MSENLFAEVKKLNKQIRELLADNERLKGPARRRAPVNDNEKLKKLAFYCTALATRNIFGHTCGDSVIEHAAALARELFPPMAKPLVWEKGMYSLRCGNYWVSMGGFEAWLKETKLGSFGSIDAAKSACEAHSQARFLGQMA